MNQKLKKITFALGFILLLAGCQVEEFQKRSDLDTSQITITTITKKIFLQK
jgi:PBP1b-binding outer membrane lipoprotein LpoB